MDADPQTGMLVGETQTFPDGTAKYSEYRIGGTSLASPLYAGIEAIADQVYGRSHGFANPAIYALYGTQRAARHRPAEEAAGGRAGQLQQQRRRDATGPPRSCGRSTTRPSRSTPPPGWDTITGVGTPNGLTYLTNLGIEPVGSPGRERRFTPRRRAPAACTPASPRWRSCNDDPAAGGITREVYTPTYARALERVSRVDARGGPGDAPRRRRQPVRVVGGLGAATPRGS